MSSSCWHSLSDVPFWGGQEKGWWPYDWGMTLYCSTLSLSLTVSALVTSFVCRLCNTSVNGTQSWGTVPGCRILILNTEFDPGSSLGFHKFSANLSLAAPECSTVYAFSMSMRWWYSVQYKRSRFGTLMVRSLDSHRDSDLNVDTRFWTDGSLLHIPRRARLLRTNISDRSSKHVI